MDTHFRDQVREATNIVEVIGERVPLKSSGSGRFVGLCPFHQEKTPSFQVDENRQFFHCFGCKKGGDVFHFLMETEGLGFPEALHQLAGRAGIPIPQRNPKREARFEAMRKATRAAFDHYQAALAAPGGRKAREYLTRRRVSPEEIGEHGFGFAPGGGGSTLLAKLEKQGMPPKLLVETGLARESSDRPGEFFDFFRNRLILPIHDATGQIAGFAGRSLDGKEPKYINSPDSPIYRKKTVLFGMRRARRAIREGRSAVLLEGYFDCMAAWRAGVPQAVAVCGTSFTSEHASLLKAHAREVVLCFDADSGGRRAVLRSLPILLARELRVRVASLGDGQDPDDFIGDRGAEAFRRTLADAPDFVAFLTALERGSEGKDRATHLHEVLEILSCWPSALEREAWTDEAAEAMGFSREAARSEMARILERKPVAPPPAADPRPARDDADEDPWKGMDWGGSPARAAPKLTVAERDFIRWGDERPREVADLLRRVSAEELRGFTASRILEGMKRAADEGADTAEALFGGEAADWTPEDVRLFEMARSEAVPLNTRQQAPFDCLRALLARSAERARKEAGSDLVRVQELTRRLELLRRPDVGVEDFRTTPSHS